MLRICFELFEWALECFESLSNGLNLNSNATNAFRIIRIYFRMLRIPFEWLEFSLECFEFLSNGSNLHSNASKLFGYNVHSSASNHFRMVVIWF